MLKWLLLVALGLATLVALLAVVGTFLPKGHRASRTVVYAASPARVFATITDFARFPEWRSDVKTVELLGDDGQGVRFREEGKHGAVKYHVELRQPDSKLVTRIDDPSLPFGGSWTLELQPVPEGTALTITEDGEVYNPIFRVLSKTIFSPYSTIDTYQADLRKRLAATATRS
jgi:polyketide cyclase/dehydrase/lipid transport protein